MFNCTARVAGPHVSMLAHIDMICEAHCLAKGQREDTCLALNAMKGPHAC